MNHTLATLLFVNGQFRPVSSLPQHRRWGRKRDRIRLVTELAAYFGPSRRPTPRPVAEPSPAARHGGWTTTLVGLWLVTSLLVFVAISAASAWGAAQVNQTRRQLQFTRLLKQREWEIEQLARERRALQAELVLRQTESLRTGGGQYALNNVRFNRSVHQ